MHSHLRRLARPAIGLGLAILVVLGLAGGARAGDAKPQHRLVIQVDDNDPAKLNLALNNLTNIYEYYQQKGETVQVEQIGRASCRDRVCQYGSNSVVAVSLKKKK